MEKLVYILQCTAEGAGDELRETLVRKTVPALREAGATQVSVNVADHDVAEGSAVTIVRCEPPIRAMVSLWMQSADDRGPCEVALGAVCDTLAGYLVVESRPLVHEPPTGARAPGVNLVTCINRRPDISYETFIELWNDEHKTVALETQATTAYVRNAVVRKLVAGSPDRDGIVEESFPIEALTDPHVWYDCSNEDEYRARLKRMIASVTAFLDLAALDSVPMSEYYLG